MDLGKGSIGKLMPSQHKDPILDPQCSCKRTDIEFGLVLSDSGGSVRKFLKVGWPAYLSELVIYRFSGRYCFKI